MAACVSVGRAHRWECREQTHRQSGAISQYNNIFARHGHISPNSRFACISLVTGRKKK
jgi:hypothetical protein